MAGRARRFSAEKGQATMSRAQTTPGKPGRLRAWASRYMVECGIAHCRRFHLSHRLLTRVPGVFLGSTWYCSSECLQEAVEDRISAQLSAALAGLRRQPRMPFRLILLAQGTVTEAQLEEARVQQHRVKDFPVEDLGDTLVRLGYVTEDQVANARAAEAGCAFYVGDGESVPPACSVPRSLMEHHSAVPMHFAPGTRRLLIGFVYRLEHRLLQAVEDVTGLHLEACMITPTTFQRQLARLEAEALPEVEHDGSAVTESPAGIAALVVQQSLRSHADHVRMGTTRDAVWLRLIGAQSTRDIVVDLESEEPTLPPAMPAEPRPERRVRQGPPSTPRR